MSLAAKDAGLTIDGTVKSMMELQQRGGLISSKVLPHFAKRMSEAAKANGGLDASLKSNRVAMNQMNTGIQTAADAIFKSGWSEGLTDLFKSIGELFAENEVFFKSFGKIAGVVFKGVAFVIRDILNPVLSAFGSVLNLITTAMEKFGSWISVLLIYFTKFTPLVGTAIKAMGGFKGVLSTMGTLAKRILLPFTLILGVLEEIGEFFAPTGKKTALGFNVGDIKFPDLDLPDWLKTSGGGLKGGSPTLSYNKTKQQPLIVNTEVKLNNEIVGSMVSKTNAVRSEISSQIADNISSNY